MTDDNLAESLQAQQPSKELKRTTRAGTYWASAAVLCCMFAHGCAMQHQRLGGVRIVLSSAHLVIDASDSPGRWRRHGRERLWRRRRIDRLRLHSHPVRQLHGGQLHVAMLRAQKHRTYSLHDGACVPLLPCNGLVAGARIAKRLPGP